MTFYEYLCSVDSPRCHDVALRDEGTKEDVRVREWSWYTTQDTLRRVDEPVLSARGQMSVTVTAMRQPFMTYVHDAVFTLELNGHRFLGCKLATVYCRLDTGRVTLTFQCLSHELSMELWPLNRLISDRPIAIYATAKRHVLFAHVVAP